MPHLVAGATVQQVFPYLIAQRRGREMWTTKVDHSAWQLNLPLNEHSSVRTLTRPRRE